jgi:DNA invertase Pin-like site-specific DNA recombinase
MARKSPTPNALKAPVASPRTVSYLRVSTADQNTEKFQADVLKFANERNFGQVVFTEEKVSGKKGWKERKLGPLVDSLQAGDRLIVPELTRLGRSTIEVLDILAVTKAKGVAVYSVKEGLELNGDSMQSKVMSTMLALFAELERDFISMRTTEALKARKAAGVKLGRKPGPGKSKLDPHREDIIEDMRRGVPKTRIAQRYGATEATLHNWLKKNDIKVEVSQ